MSAHTSSPHPASSEDNQRRDHLTRLLTAVRARGGLALLALAGTDHPVLYVRHRGRLMPVVVVRGVTGGWWFIWGRSGFADAAHVEVAADHLAGPPVPPPDRDPYGRVVSLPPARAASPRLPQSPSQAHNGIAVKAVA
ncbi:hypothetical protein NOGI109294_15480 [Nocardiopsis gilva]